MRDVFFFFGLVGINCCRIVSGKWGLVSLARGCVRLGERLGVRRRNLGAMEDVLVFCY